MPTENDVKENSGLSFSTVYREGSFVTTIENLNATGVVYAVQDGVKHVSVYPIGGTIEQWYNQGAESVWTEAIMASGII